MAEIASQDLPDMPDVKSVLIKHLSELEAERPMHRQRIQAAKLSGDVTGELYARQDYAKHLTAHLHTVKELYNAYEGDHVSALRDIQAHDMLKNAGLTD